MKLLTFALGALGAAILVPLTAAPASAYVQTMTCNIGTGQYACDADEEPLPVYWPQRCIRYHINEQGTTDTDNANAFAAIQSSFQQWSEPACTNLALEFGGFTDEDRIGYNQSTGQESNANIIVFRDSGWPHSRGVLALTSVTFQSSTGKIFDADIELNSAEYRFSTTDAEFRRAIDVANTVTHEAGHFIGLDHSDVSSSTMFATAPNGEIIKRDLHTDDVEGVCAIYPTGEGDPNVCSGAPTDFFEKPLYGPGDDTPNTGTTSSGGCACVTPDRAPTSPAALLILATLLGVVTLRRR